MSSVVNRLSLMDCICMSILLSGFLLSILSNGVKGNELCVILESLVDGEYC